MSGLIEIIEHDPGRPREKCKKIDLGLLFLIICLFRIYDPICLKINKFKFKQASGEISAKVYRYFLTNLQLKWS